MLRNNSDMPKTLKNKMVSGNPRPYSINFHVYSSNRSWFVAEKVQVSSREVLLMCERFYNWDFISYSEKVHKSYVKYLNSKLYYQELCMKYLCNLV